MNFLQHYSCNVNRRVLVSRTFKSETLTGAIIPTKLVADWYTRVVVCVGVHAVDVCSLEFRPFSSCQFLKASMAVLLVYIVHVLVSGL